MHADLLVKYYKDHFDGAIAQLIAYGDKRKPEMLHQFRVNIKKIRTVIRFLRTIEPGKTLKEINRSVRTIFWKAGEVRDLQLKLSWLRRSRRYHLIRFYDLEAELRQKDAAFRENIPVYIKELKALMNEAQKEADRITQEQVDRYFGKILLDLKSHFSTELVPAEWHEMRKRNKQVLYAVHWLDEKKSQRLTRSALIKQLDIMQDTIGLWHDGILLKDWLGGKHAFLSEDKNVVRQFDLMWDKLINDQNLKSHKIKHLFSRVHKMKFVSIR